MQVLARISFFLKSGANPLLRSDIVSEDFAEPQHHAFERQCGRCLNCSAKSLQGSHPVSSGPKLA